MFIRIIRILLQIIDGLVLFFAFMFVGLGLVAATELDWETALHFSIVGAAALLIGYALSRLIKAIPKSS